MLFVHDVKHGVCVCGGGYKKVDFLEYMDTYSYWLPPSDALYIKQ